MSGCMGVVVMCLYQSLIALYSANQAIVQLVFLECPHMCDIDKLPITFSQHLKDLACMPILTALPDHKVAPMTALLATPSTGFVWQRACFC